MKTKQNKAHCPVFTTWLSDQADELGKSGRFSTARNYRRVLSSYSAFSAQTPDIPAWPDEAAIIKYDTWLKYRGVVRNTISFYMRILRASCNKAKAYGITGLNPTFESVYTGIDKTRKRAIDEDIILMMLKLDLTERHSLSLARDIFLFSYCTRGMAFVDIAFLKRKDICNGNICYSRRKTGQRMSIRIEECLKSIIDKYMEGGNRPYLFPLIRSSNPETAFRQYQTALGYYNRNLKILGKDIGAGAGISSYMARHSWASNARKHNIPLSIISAGMGHESEKATLIYLDSIDNSDVDTANNKILASLNRAISM